MIGKILNAKLLHILLGFALLIGLLPISNHMLPMQTMRLDATATSQFAAFQSNPVQRDAGGNSTRSCCDAMGAFSPACDLVVSQSVHVASYEGGKQIANSDPIFQSVYIHVIAPPPKA